MTLRHKTGQRRYRTKQSWSGHGPVHPDPSLSLCLGTVSSLLPEVSSSPVCHQGFNSPPPPSLEFLGGNLTSLELQNISLDYFPCQSAHISFSY